MKVAKKFSKWVENTVGKGEIAPYEQFLPFFDSVFNRLLLQTRQNLGLFGKELRLSNGVIANAEPHSSVGSVQSGYFRLFIVATGCPSERRPQMTVSCYGG